MDFAMMTILLMRQPLLFAAIMTGENGPNAGGKPRIRAGNPPRKSVCGAMIEAIEFGGDGGEQLAIAEFLRELARGLERAPRAA